jgi:putative ABC transport system permease protein
MKRNGAGLASIAIISTMVLVILSSTTCLWFGTQRMITSLYPGDVNFMINFDDSDQLTDENINFIKEYIDGINREENVDASVALDIRYLTMFGNADGDTIDFEMSSMDEYSSDIIRSICIVSLGNYNEQTGSSLSLSDDEAIIFTSGCKFNHDTITLSCGDVSDSFRIVRPDTEKFSGTDFMKDIVPLIILVVPDFIGVADDFSECVDLNDYSIMDMRWIYSVDIATDGIVSSEYGSAVTEKLRDTLEDNYYWMYFQDREEGESEYLALNGSFLFLGIMLSIIFALAAVLIIYYKQISEGYEDSKRFGVMRKVGMTGKDIKRSINSQLLVVFFIPLVFAGVHLLFAFPIISKLLVLFGLYDVTPFMITTLVSFILFALFYASVYKVTSNVYYNIVSGTR